MSSVDFTQSSPERLGPGGYSAKVRLYLQVDDQTLSLSQVGGGRVYFSEPTSVRPGPALLTVEVDGDPLHKQITILGNGAPARIVCYED